MITRRQTVAGLATLAVIQAPSAQALPVSWPPVLPPLPPLSPEHVANLLRGYDRHRPRADDLTIPEKWRVLYQHLAGGRLAGLAFPHANAVARLESITMRWPRLKPNIDLVIETRMAGRDDWTWSYARVRLDGGP